MKKEDIDRINELARKALLFIRRFHIYRIN